MTTNVSLTPELEAYIHEKMKSGGYKSISEVIREGLRLLKERDVEKDIKLKALRAEIKKGLESGKSTLLDFDAIKEKGRKRLAQKKRK